MDWKAKRAQKKKREENNEEAAWKRWWRKDERGQVSKEEDGELGSRSLNREREELRVTEEKRAFGGKGRRNWRDESGWNGKRRGWERRRMKRDSERERGRSTSSSQRSNIQRNVPAG